VEHVPAQIRPATAVDLVAVLHLDPLALAGDRQRAEFLSRSTAVGECHVSVAGGTVTGFVVRRPAHFFGRDFVELLVVDTAYRRSGIGRALLRHALDTAFSTQVFTSTNVSNTPMRALLRAEDWSFSGQLDGLDEGDPELFFYKHRSAPVG
jgi:ribosomal protein S18 acetylase RimI-like enzyme